MRWKGNYVRFFLLWIQKFRQLLEEVTCKGQRRWWLTKPLNGFVLFHWRLSHSHVFFSFCFKDCQIWGIVSDDSKQKLLDRLDIPSLIYMFSYLCKCIHLMHSSHSFIRRVWWIKGIKLRVTAERPVLYSKALCYCVLISLHVTLQQILFKCYLRPSLKEQRSRFFCVTSREL